MHAVDGVYDDHDFGENDGGVTNPHRELARQLFLDKVVREPATSERRLQRGGLYGTRVFGHPPQQVCISPSQSEVAWDHQDLDRYKWAAHAAK